MDFILKEQYDINDLLKIMEILRSPGGCPWDIEQTHESIRRNFIEETYEVAEAIDTGDTGLLREELGDVLMQVVFHSHIEKEKGAFDFDGVCDGVCKKMILRHPHIFSDVRADTSDEVLKNWDAIKKEEKNHETYTQVLSGISKTLPALMRADKLQGKAFKLGFSSKSLEETLMLIRTGTDDIEKAANAGDDTQAYEDFCCLLYNAVGVARHIKADPEHGLNYACDRFIMRFSKTEMLAAERGIELESAGNDVLISLWQEAQK